MLNKEQELMRVAIFRGGARSTVSMDAYLAKVLSDQLIKEKKSLQQWVQETADLLDAQWGNKAMQVRVGERVRAKSGLSRQIQREAIKRILENLQGPIR